MEGSNRLLQLKEEGMKSLFPATAKIMVGMATCGVAAGAGEVWDASGRRLRNESWTWRSKRPAASASASMSRWLISSCRIFPGNL